MNAQYQELIQLKDQRKPFWLHQRISYASWHCYLPYLYPIQKAVVSRSTRSIYNAMFISAGLQFCYQTDNLGWIGVKPSPSPPPVWGFHLTIHYQIYYTSDSSYCDSCKSSAVHLPTFLPDYQVPSVSSHSGSISSFFIISSQLISSSFSRSFTTLRSCKSSINRAKRFSGKTT